MWVSRINERVTAAGAAERISNTEQNARSLSTPMQGRELNHQQRAHQRASNVQMQLARFAGVTCCRENTLPPGVFVPRAGSMRRKDGDLNLPEVVVAEGSSSTPSNEGPRRLRADGLATTQSRMAEIEPTAHQDGTRAANGELGVDANRKYPSKQKSSQTGSLRIQMILEDVMYDGPNEDHRTPPDSGELILLAAALKRDLILRQDPSRLREDGRTVKDTSHEKQDAGATA
ncbi:hypothetical protein B0H11DRAFT_1923997 [Mycena galericulata]|nr:hypothetical protein B0H11DRAFT_1923997 [Mycena galericulata]